MKRRFFSILLILSLALSPLLLSSCEDRTHQASYHINDNDKNMATYVRQQEADRFTPEEYKAAVDEHAPEKMYEGFSYGTLGELRAMPAEEKEKLRKRVEYFANTMYYVDYTTAKPEDLDKLKPLLDDKLFQAMKQNDFFNNLVTDVQETKTIINIYGLSYYDAYYQDCTLPDGKQVKRTLVEVDLQAYSVPFNQRRPWFTGGLASIYLWIYYYNEPDTGSIKIHSAAECWKGDALRDNDSYQHAMFYKPEGIEMINNVKPDIPQEWTVTLQYDKEDTITFDKGKKVIGILSSIVDAAYTTSSSDEKQRQLAALKDFMSQETYQKLSDRFNFAQLATDLTAEGAKAKYLGDWHMQYPFVNVYLFHDAQGNEFIVTHDTPVYISTALPDDVAKRRGLKNQIWSYTIYALIRPDDQGNYEVLDWNFAVDNQYSGDEETFNPDQG